ASVPLHNGSFVIADRDRARTKPGVLTVLSAHPILRFVIRYGVIGLEPAPHAGVAIFPMHKIPPTQTKGRVRISARKFKKSIANVISSAVRLLTEYDVGSSAHNRVQFLVLVPQFAIEY